MTTVTVANVGQGDNGVTQVSPVAVSAAKPRAGWPVVIWSMVTVAAATAVMWVAYRHWIKPSPMRVRRVTLPTPDRWPGPAGRSAPLLCPGPPLSLAAQESSAESG